MALCPGCGNDVRDTTNCPICKAGRAVHKAPRQPPEPVDNTCHCPRCNAALAQQDWEGIAILGCPTCRGAFFPGSALEQVLDKLRADAEPVDTETVLKEFKDRFSRQLPEAVRYKACPVCNEVMLRRNYGTVSGVIVDTCCDHGTWVDEAQFAALADFICRGGDLLAAEIGKVRARIQVRGTQIGPTPLKRFFGKR